MQETRHLEDEADLLGARDGGPDEERQEDDYAQACNNEQHLNLTRGREGPGPLDRPCRRCQPLTAMNRQPYERPGVAHSSAQFGADAMPWRLSGSSVRRP